MRLLALVTLELLLASRALPHNRLVPPDMLTSERFSVSQMQVYAEREQPPGRLLSISGLLFDPGDRAALEARFARLAMNEEEIRIAFVAIKQQEILAANLPLYWGIPTIDGFDGGVLPTRYYTAFTSLLLPEGTLRTMDGRLREALAGAQCGGACIPDQRWLNLTHTRYLLLDKVHDLWQDDIAYDTAFTIRLPADERAEITPDPLFAADGLALVCADAAACRARVLFTYADGSSAVLSPGEPSVISATGQALHSYRLPDAPSVPLPAPIRITLAAEDAPLAVRAATLIDARTGDFQQLAFAPWTRILSSDIKLYENAQVLPRAFVVDAALWVADDIYGTEDALALMRDPAFNPARTIILHGTGESMLPTDNDAAPSPFQAHISVYQPERVIIDVEADRPGYLLLTDAYYPGWQARVDGAAAPILRANVMFRAVALPAGAHEIVFEYRPAWLGWLPLGAAAWGALTFFVLLKHRRG